MAARGETRGVALLALVVMAACAPAHPPGPPDRPQSITEILGGGDATAFARALTPPELRFPEDHGPHDDFRTEWWYFTGNLTDADGGHRFGYQLTFFRSALTADPAQRSSTWATSQAYMSHFALSDPDGEPAGFHDFERYARAAAGMAGAEASPFRVWLEDWSAVGGSDIPPIRLRAAEEGIAIDLELDAGKPLVLQGDRGLSRKGRALQRWSRQRRPQRLRLRSPHLQDPGLGRL